MRAKVEANLGHGIGGWKARQERARRKNVNSEERDKIRAIRKAHREESERRLAEEESGRKTETEIKVSYQPQPAKQADPDSGPESPPAEEPTPVDDRAALTAELDALGIRWHPNSKTETLERKLQEAKREEA